MQRTFLYYVLLIFWFFVVLPCCVIAQNKSIDSLKKIESSFNKSKPDTIQLHIYNELCYYYKNIANYSEATRYAQIEVEIATKIHSDLYLSTGLQNIGLLHYEQGKYDESINYFLKALAIREKINNKVSTAMLVNNIGLVYFATRNLPEAKKYFQRSFAMIEQCGKISGKAVGVQANNYNNIGLINYYGMSFDTALFYFGKGLELRHLSGDRQKIAESFINIGNVYFMKQDFKKTEEYYATAKGIFDTLGDKRNSAILSINMAELSFKGNNKSKGFLLANQALKIAKEIKGLEIEKAVYDLLQSQFNEGKDYKNAYKYLELSALFRDSMLNEKNQKIIAEMQEKYQAEKKDKELLKKNAEILTQKADIIEREAHEKKQGLIIYAGSACLLLVCGLVFFVYKNSRNKTKINIMITKQKELVELQKTLVEEKQKEILDSIHYAKRIQTALLTSEKYITRRLQSLNKN